jgi:peptidoglycan hydrolase CwlO-like protein
MLLTCITIQNTVAIDFVSSLDVISLSKNEEVDNLIEEVDNLIEDVDNLIEDVDNSNEEGDDVNKEVEDEHEEIKDEDIVNNVNEEIIEKSMGILKM